MNKAVHYLGRYTSSRQRLREVLKRFAVRKLENHDRAEVERALEKVVADCVRLGYVDDTAFALSRARGKRRAGRSALAIRRSLQEHAIDPQLVDDALQAADEDMADGELAAALRHAARRRIGPTAFVRSMRRGGTGIWHLWPARVFPWLSHAGDGARGPAAADELVEELRDRPSPILRNSGTSV